MKSQFTFIDLFAGIGGIRIPFEDLGGECVFSSEWDRPCQITYQANFKEIPCGDITKIKPEQIPFFDILLAGFPCQPFSQAGTKKGFGDTRGTLFFDISKLYNACIISFLDLCLFLNIFFIIVICFFFTLNVHWVIFT